MMAAFVSLANENSSGVQGGQFASRIWRDLMPLSHPTMSPRQRNLICLHFILVGGLSGQLQAQVVSASHAEFLKRVLGDSQILSDQYERALAKLESELAAGADYEEALLVQRRRDELKAIYGQVSTNNASNIALQPSRARLSGSAEARGEVLTGWRGSSSMAEWSNVKVSPGSYYLELEATITGLPTSAGGALPERFMPQDKASFDFYEVSLLPGAQENRRNFEIARAANDDAFVPLRIGPLNFIRNSVTLRIVPTTSYPGNVIFMRNLRLSPASDGPLKSAAPVPEGDLLALARDALHRELTRAQQSVIKAHSEALAVLAKNPDLRDEVTAETERMTELQRSNLNLQDDVLKRLLRQLGGVSGFSDIEGAKLVTTDSTSSGDQFIVEHEGKQIPIRLLWVRCSPLEARSDDARNFAKYFHMDEEDAAPLARTAREFTLGYLAEKPLRVLLRPNKNKDGKQLALVFLPETGLYQNVLVEQGFAMVETRRKSPGAGMTERGLLDSLQQSEDVARRLKHGAWALSRDSKP